jgi:FkbM family methyltransferase
MAHPVRQKTFFGIPYWKEVCTNYRIYRYFLGIRYYRRFNIGLLFKNQFLYGGVECWPDIPWPAEQFTLKFQKLTAGLDEESRDTVLKIMNRLQRVKTDPGGLDIFTEPEKRQLSILRDEFYSKIIQWGEGVYSYENYRLPVNEFEPHVFYYRNNLEYVKNIDYLKDKDIIDAGGYVGDSALIFAGLTNKKVYSFEPVSAQAALMHKTFELNKVANGVIEHLALGEEPGELELVVNGSGSTLKETNTLNRKFRIRSLSPKSRVDTLDNYVAANNLEVGLIKTDVEGFEQPLLRGAENTIKTQKPVLLISIYHNIDDFFSIKPLIESWNLGYEFKIVKPVDGNIIRETMLIAEVPRPSAA